MIAIFNAVVLSAILLLATFHIILARTKDSRVRKQIFKWQDQAYTNLLGSPPYRHVNILNLGDEKFKELEDELRERIETQGDAINYKYLINSEMENLVAEVKRIKTKIGQLERKLP